MMVIVSYDIDTKSAAGRARLRHVSKICLDFGQRVQNSVFECKVNSTELEILKENLLSEIDQDSDSLYFFNLGSNYSNKISSYGNKSVFDLDSAIVF